MNVSTKSGVLVALVFAGAAAAASAHEAQQPPPPPSQNPPAETPTQPVAAPPLDAAVVSTSLNVSELRRRREAIDAMEGMLPKNVLAAARDTMREMEVAQQTAVNLFTNSTPRARGFHLEGYGVFFYVEIPGVRASVASVVEQLQRGRDRLTGNASRTAESAGPPMPFDANNSYTDAVRRRLIDAILDYSQPLDLRPYEWLTIAARDGDEPIPNVVYESITMVVRARGADLADFRANRINREEMLKRVEVRGF